MDSRCTIDSRNYNAQTYMQKYKHTHGIQNILPIWRFRRSHLHCRVKKNVILLVKEWKKERKERESITSLFISVALDLCLVVVDVVFCSLRSLPLCVVFFFFVDTVIIRHVHKMQIICIHYRMITAPSLTITTKKRWKWYTHTKAIHTHGERKER